MAQANEQVNTVASRRSVNYTPFSLVNKKLIDRKVPIYATSYDNERRTRARRGLFRFGARTSAQIDNIEGYTEIKEFLDFFQEELQSSSYHWKSIADSKMALIALSLSVNNLIRFPYACCVHGGVIFFAAYLIIMLLFTQPLLFLEALIGQFSHHGLFGFAKLWKFSAGLPYALVWMSLIFVPNNNIVLAYSGLYAIGSFYTNPTRCDQFWNSYNHCTTYDVSHTNNFYISKKKFSNGSSMEHFSTELYYRQFILGLDWNTFASIASDRVLIGLSLVYFVTFIAIFYNFASRLSKVIIWMSCTLPIIILAIVIHQYVHSSISKVLISKFDWTKAVTFDFWCEAIRMSFSTVTAGYCVVHTVTAHNEFYFRELYKATWQTCLIGALFSLFASFIVFSELDIIEFITRIEDFPEVLSSNIGISFICLSGSLMRMATTKDHFWPMTILFFVITIVGMWSQIAATETCVAFLEKFKIIKHYPKLNRLAMLGIVIFIQICFSIAYATESGYLLLKAGNLMCGTWAACVILMVEVITVLFYGSQMFALDIEVLLNRHPPILFLVQVKYLLLPFLILTFILFSMDIFFRPSVTYRYDYTGIQWYGAILNVVPLILLLVFGLRTTCIQKINQFVHPRRRTSDKLDRLWRPEFKLFGIKYKRWTQRRNAVFAKPSVLEASHYSPENEIEFPDTRMIMRDVTKVERQRFVDYLDYIRRIIDLVQRKRVICKWHHCVNLVTMSTNQINTFPRAAMWLLRDRNNRKNLEEVKYLKQVLATSEIENLVGALALEDVTEETYDKKQVLDHLLRSMPLPTFYHDPNYGEESVTSLYNMLVGRLQDPYEERYEEMIIRVKRDLGEHFEENLIKLRNLRKARISAAVAAGLLEYPPEEIIVPIKHRLTTGTWTAKLRVVIIRGANHSLLQKLPNPKPLIKHIPQEKLTAFPTKEKRNKFIMTEAVLAMLKHYEGIPEIKNDTFDHMSIKDNIDMEVYTFLTAENTCIVVIDEKIDLEDKLFWGDLANFTVGGDKHRWLHKPLRRKFSVVEDEEENANKKLHRTISEFEEINFVTLHRRDVLHSTLKKHLLEPSDIIYLSDALDVSPVHSSSSEGSDTELLVPLSQQNIRDIYQVPHHMPYTDILHESHSADDLHHIHPSEHHQRQEFFALDEPSLQTSPSFSSLTSSGVTNLNMASVVFAEMEFMKEAAVKHELEYGRKIKSETDLRHALKHNEVLPIIDLHNEHKHHKHHHHHYRGSLRDVHDPLEQLKKKAHLKVISITTSQFEVLRQYKNVQKIEADTSEYELYYYNPTDDKWMQTDDFLRFIQHGFTYEFPPGNEKPDYNYYPSIGNNKSLTVERYFSM